MDIGDNPCWIHVFLIFPFVNTYLCIVDMLQVIAGKGHETYQIEGDKNDFFDDREECREALQYVDDLHQAGIDTSEFPWR